MPTQLQSGQITYLVSRNFREAKKTLKKIKMGEIDPENVLFEKSDKAQRRINALPGDIKRFMRVFEISWI